MKGDGKGWRRCALPTGKTDGHHDANGNRYPRDKPKPPKRQYERRLIGYAGSEKRGKMA